MSSAGDVSSDAGDRFFKELADFAPVMIWRAGPDALCDWFNKPWLDFVGRSMEQEVGNGWIENVHPDDFDRCQGTYISSFNARRSFTMTYRLKRHDNQYRDLLDNGSAFYRDGNFAGYFGSCIDVTDMKAMEEQLRQSQKMEAIGQLTGGVAHDFNNLLTVIKSSIDLLQRPNLIEERRRRYLSAIADTVDRAAKLTGQLLAFARRQALKPVVFDVCESIRLLTDMMGTLTGSRIEVLTELPSEPCFVNADPSQLDTAIVNMAVNARDAMNGQGRITIMVRAVEGMPAIRSHASHEGSYVTVSLIDTGSGIALDQLASIFEPFFTTKEMGKGTGLGLSQVFGFAKQSGGEIFVASKLGKGTTFTLYLPRATAPRENTGTVEAEGEVDGHDMRVLVVEDNADVGSFTVQSLTDLGFRTFFAASAAAALAELAKREDRFDIVFSDVVMPDMSGIELGQEIRRLYHDLPVVLTSGYSHVLAQNGADGFDLLHKPYSVEELSRILHKTAARQRRKRSEVFTGVS